METGAERIRVRENKIKDRDSQIDKVVQRDLTKFTVHTKSQTDWRSNRNRAEKRTGRQSHLKRNVRVWSKFSP